MEISTKSNKIIIVTIYRPPKAQAADDTALYEEIKFVIQNNQAVIIGDFDYLSIDWASIDADRESNRLTEKADDAFLKQTVTQPKQENNILDLVFASDPDLIRVCKVGEKLGGCDHHLIRFNIKTEYTLTDNKTKIPDYRKTNFNSARQLPPPVAWKTAKPHCCGPHGQTSRTNSWKLRGQQPL